MIDNNDLLSIEKKLSLMNIIMSIFMLIYYSLFYWFKYKNLGINSLIFSSLIVLFVIEFVISKYDYFNSDFMFKTIKFAEMLSCSVIAFHCGGFVINILLFGGIYFLISFQSTITYDITENYYKISSIIFTCVPMILVIAYEAILQQNSNFWVFLFLIFIVIFASVQYCFIDVFADIVNRFYKTINNLNGIASTNQEENDSMKVTQNKLVQANEQLSLQKFKLQKANEQIVRNNMEIQLQNSITKNFSNSLDMDEILKMIADTVLANLGCDLCSAGVVCQEQNADDMFFNYAKYTDKSLITDKNCKLITGKKSVEDFYENMAVIDIADYANIKFEQLSGTNIKSLIIDPVYISDDAYCVFALGSCKKDFFDDNKTFLKNLSNQITLSISNALLYYKMSNMAIKDPLTGIYNRRHFNGLSSKYSKDYIEKAKIISIVLFDIDKFKNINDTYGHVFGDEVISFCGKISNKYAAKYEGLPVRYGGEEFVLVFPEKQSENVLEICNDLQNEIKEHRFEHNGTEVHINISVGIAAYPETCSNFDELLSAADSAMYSSKQNGRGRITIYK